jgi:hypothetical protein
MVHLCSGDYPDFFTEIIFGKIAAVEPPRWHTAYLARCGSIRDTGRISSQPVLPPDRGEPVAPWC